MRWRSRGAWRKRACALSSTFTARSLQRSFDHIFQEVFLQNLPVTFCWIGRVICGADGPTHHGNFDNAYMRIFPNMVIWPLGDEQDVGG